jgi:hypothetical protein
MRTMSELGASRREPERNSFSGNNVTSHPGRCAEKYLWYSNGFCVGGIRTRGRERTCRDLLRGSVVAAVFLEPSDSFGSVFGGGKSVAPDSSRARGVNRTSPSSQGRSSCLARQWCLTLPGFQTTALDRFVRCLGRHFFGRSSQGTGRSTFLRKIRGYLHRVRGYFRAGCVRGCCVCG